MAILDNVQRNAVMQKKADAFDAMQTQVQQQQIADTARKAGLQEAVAGMIGFSNQPTMSPQYVNDYRVANGQVGASTGYDGTSVVPAAQQVVDRQASAGQPTMSREYAIQELLRRKQAEQQDARTGGLGGQAYYGGLLQ